MKNALRKIQHYRTALGLRGAAVFILARVFKLKPVFATRMDSIQHPVHVRIGTTDASVLRQVLIEKHYNYNLPKTPEIIIDAGANIGLSAVFFANRYPGARILAVEPEPENFRILQKNVARYPQIQPIQAALWFKNDHIALFDPGQGSHGFQTQDANAAASVRNLVKAMTVESLMAEMKVPFVDVLKMDIEGSEREVFKHSQDWIKRVGVVMAELHDHIKPGCSDALAEATAGFADGGVLGETVIRINAHYASAGGTPAHGARGLTADTKSN